MAQAILDTAVLEGFGGELLRDGYPGYVNFTGDPSASAVEAGFGPEKYARLVEIKRAYDPENVFRSNTNIPPDA
jgi:Berberine and berberine like